MVGTILSMLGNQAKTQGTEAADRANRDMAFYAARENEQQTTRAVTAAQTNETQQLGSVRAAYGASGVTMSGTAANVMQSQAGVMNAKVQGILSAGTFKTEQLDRESKMYEAAKEYAGMAGSYGGASAAIGGIQNDASMIMGS